MAGLARWMLRLVCCAAVVWGVRESACEGQTQGTWTLTNPTALTYENELVRPKVELPASAVPGQYVVKAGGREVASQLDEVEGKKYLWVAASIQPGAAIEYTVERGRPAAVRPLAWAKREGETLVLDNGTFAVRVPAAAQDAPPPPVLAVRLLDGKWVGRGFWHTARKLRGFSAQVLGEGPLLAKVRLRWEFEGQAGLWQNVPSFAEVVVSVAPGHQHATIEEAHEMDCGDYWEFDAAAGFAARKAICITHGRMPAHGGPEVPLPSTLRPGQTRMGETLVNLQPRWTQAYDEGWLFVCHDDRQAAGALVCRAGRWHWPHNNLIEVKVKPSADYAGLRCPTWKGRRYWFLVAGPQALWQGDGAKQYAVRHAFQPLDKLHHDYILDWPGLEKLLGTGSGKQPNPGRFQGMDFYSSWMNPTGGLRGFGRNAVAAMGRQGNLNTLTQVQVFFDPDSYGSYWNFWSPENPNFFTDFHRGPIALTTQLRNHPRFAELAKMAEQKMHEDLYHSITLPGGAGQECPGYVAYAMGNWQMLAPGCKQYLGFDPTRWPRFRAGASFLVHLSQPIGGGQRRCHPGGDTHPPGPDVAALAEQFGVREDVRRFVTEELPGFGVVFRNRPGSEQETYLAFKSGPNRGHYHGDQLSFHYCAHARPLAIDHMCSYAPRAGQEHMHNRVAFHTERLPWANMDGYERVIAFQRGNEVDVAIGQVESERLRITTEYPPEEWDTYLPEERFDTLLRYRRTIVFVKDQANQGEDYFVIRDQHDGPQVKATYCLHVVSDRCEHKGQRVEFDRLTLFCAKPADVAFARHDWQFEKTDRSGNVTFREATKGVRLATAGAEGEFITVLYPSAKPPAIEPIEGGVRVGSDEITFGGAIDDENQTVYVAVRRGGRQLLALTGQQIDLDRSQGEVGLFVPDAGYPFGEIPAWLIKQRCQVPDWAPDWARAARRFELP